MLLTETGDGVVVGMLIRGQIAERYVVVGRLLDGSRAGDSDAVAI